MNKSGLQVAGVERSAVECTIADAWDGCVRIAASSFTRSTSNFLCYIIQISIHDIPSGIAAHEAVSYHNKAQKALI